VTPAPIDLKVVGDRLRLVSECLEKLRAIPATSLEAFRADPRNAPAVESLVRHAIEALFDTARHILAKRFGLGALEYREVARVSGDHGLIVNPGLRQRFVEIGGFRNRITNFYDEVTAEELFGVATRDLGDLAAIAQELRQAAARFAAGP